MDAIEKRARELLAAHAEDSGYIVREYEAIAAIIAALTPPEGYVLVPVELVTAIEDLSLIYEAGGDIDCKLSQVEELLAARPEVP